MSSIDHKDKLWRSLTELSDRDAYNELNANEFPPAATDSDDESALNRRRFVQLMGASVALAGATGAAGCRWEEEKILPLSTRPDDYVPGVPKRFATIMDLGGSAIGVLATSYEGRPVKIEGNPEHPHTLGGSTAFAQAAILGMYDPDRSKTVQNKGTRSTWTAFGEAVKALDTNAPLHVLSEASSSPTVRALRDALAKKFTNLEWHEYEAISRDNVREGTRMAFGQPMRPLLDLSKADTIVALDADLFVDDPAALSNSRGFATRRRPEGKMSRLYAVESAFSSTGATADHRLPLRSEFILPFVMSIAARLVNKPGPNAAFLQEKKVAAFRDAIVDELKANRKTAVLAAGYRQPAEVHAIVAQINRGAMGTTITYIDDAEPARPTHAASIAALAGKMAAGTVSTLIILGGNPSYNAPADLQFARALAKVKTSVHLGLYDNETAAGCTWHLPRTHFLEAWGDGTSYDGTYSVAQPIIKPLYEGRSAIEVLAMMVGRTNTNAKDLVHATFKQLSGATVDEGPAWRKTLHDGFLAKRLVDRKSPGLRPFAQPTLSPRQNGGFKQVNGQLEVVFTPSSHTYDGRFANNAWLQETPDFLTKLVWDNAALIGPQTASDLGIAHNSLVKLTVGKRQIEVAVYVMPGQAPYSIALALGHGRTRAGRVAGSKADNVSPKGFDTYGARSSNAMLIATGASVQRIGSYNLVGTQDHWAIDAAGREATQKRLPELIQEATPARLVEYEQELAEYKAGTRKKTPHLATDPHLDYPIRSLWKQPVDYSKGNKWGMATDLGKCTGCNACLLACQAENNVPVVGKRETARSREMNWIRIDRYFKGDIDDPQLVHQPVACQQCENAPCEEVCPVGATVHSDEGLNDMVYNRCVGTRYCMNNCPYKVRRFNFLHWTKNLDESRNKSLKLAMNPEVTVRSRGVMEKCTFCVQRIAAATIPARNKGEKLAPNAIKTACQQACPTGAIVFGDLNNKDDEVTALHESARRYELLEDLNTKPRNLYLARIRNTNPKLAKS